MSIESLDPRFNREILETATPHENLGNMDHFQNYEVFMQERRGKHHVHVGSVHAPNAEMALLFGKEQYGRRGINVNIWVTKTADILVSEYEDEDIFETVGEKLHREPGAYKVMDRIKAFKERQSI